MFSHNTIMDNQKSKIYYGRLTAEQIEWINQAMDIMLENAYCHTNAYIRNEIKNVIEKEFIEPKSIDEPTIDNKYMKTIKVQC